MKVSICLPTHGMNGKGAEYLEFNFNCIKQQTYSDMEIIISDQSEDNLIENLCEKWKGELDIKYTRFDSKRKSTENINNTLINATGDILKPLFLDDFFYTTNCVEHMVESLNKNPEKGWVVTGFGHLFVEQNSIGNFRVPRYHDMIHRGENTLSCPSTVALRNTGKPILFDENIIWLCDCEWYKRLENKFGTPLIIEHPSVIMRVHSDSVSASWDSKQNEKEKELQYVIKKIEGTKALN